MTTTSTLAAFTADKRARMARAFDLVCPQKHAAELAERGLITRGSAAERTWRDPINAVVTDGMLIEAGVSIADVAEAIAFYTATEARISAERIGSLPWVSFIGGTDGFYVRAIGYRRGPAA